MTGLSIVEGSASGRVDEWKRVRDGYWESGGKLEELRDQGALVRHLVPGS
jgi:hypothetical protein